MARVRSTARVEREGGEAEGSETVPISEASASPPSCSTLAVERTLAI